MTSPRVPDKRKFTGFDEKNARFKSDSPPEEEKALEEEELCREDFLEAPQQAHQFPAFKAPPLPLPPFESISIKIVKFLANYEQLKERLAVAAGPYLRPEKVPGGRSQITLITKINLHQCGSGKPGMDPEGVCHGLGLTWLAMIDWAMAAVFRHLVRMIVACPPEELYRLGFFIDHFAEMIDVGQHPEEYGLNRQDVYDIARLIGNTRELFAFSGTYTKQGLLKDLAPQLKTRTMVCLMGFEPAAAAGHSIQVYGQEEDAILFDSNFKRGEAKTVDTAKKLASLSWGRLFDKDDKNKERRLVMKGVGGRIKPKGLEASVASLCSMFGLQVGPSEEKERPPGQGEALLANTETRKNTPQ